MKKIYVIWVGWIWVSAIARYYNKMWYQVYWSDKFDSELIHNLRDEWIDIMIWEDEKRLEEFFNSYVIPAKAGIYSKEKRLEIGKDAEYFESNYSKEKTIGYDEKIDSWSGQEWHIVIYTEAIPLMQSELKKANELWIRAISYPVALSEIANSKKLIAISWTHGKSTTTSLVSIVLKNSEIWVNSVVWSILKEFWNKNAYFSDSDYFVIEACEYKRSFLKYKPFIAIITNIDLDHLDYYKDLDDYLSAFQSFIENVIPWWYAILNWNCSNSMRLLWLRDDVNYIVVTNNSFSVIPAKAGIYKNVLPPFVKGARGFLFSIHEWQVFLFPQINMQIPWEHILFDAKFAFTVWKILNLEDNEIIKSLENYNWIWRRSEIVWTTLNWNILMSDYWHHPTEIVLNTKAIKEKYRDKKIICIFQPHQYNRTLELLEDFKNCFIYVDKLVIPDIYESRDTEEDKRKINSEKLVKYINHSDKLDWKWLENTLNWIIEYDKNNPNSSVIILQWAWNIDDLRYKIKTV